MVVMMIMVAQDFVSVLMMTNVKMKALMVMVIMIMCLTLEKGILQL